jgi:hypothetical protein
MRTTLDINDELFRLAKRRAADENAPLRKVVEEALRTYLTPGRKTRTYRLEWHTEKGTLQPGVQLEDRDALFDLMEGRR